MSGLFLIVLAGLGIFFLISSIVFDWGDLGIASGIFLGIAIIMIVAIPISRIESKSNAEYVKVLQETINENRSNQQEFNVLERTEIIEDINRWNLKITTWKIKGEKWYNNKWYYHPSVRDVQYLK